MLLVAPSKDGMELAMASVRDYLAWETVLDDVKKQQKDGNVDPARAQTLRINIDKAKGRIPEAIRTAYSVVVTESEKDEVHAFKVTVTDEPHFNIIKANKQSRVQDTAITAEALLPDGPYNLWREGETARRVKDLAGAFAQLPHLPKMLKASAILDTLVDGCEQGTFVLRLTRPDGTSRSWWMSKPDVISGALQARFLEPEAGSQAWPCDFPSALFLKVKVATAGGKGGTGGTGGSGGAAVPKMLVGVADLEPSQVQDLGDIVPSCWTSRTSSTCPSAFK